MNASTLQAYPLAVNCFLTLRSHPLSLLCQVWLKHRPEVRPRGISGSMPYRELARFRKPLRTDQLVET
jgi:hypothetical protein